MFVRYLGHGDTKNVILIAGQHCGMLRVRVAGIRHRRATSDPVFVLSDLDLGMNMWMSDPFDYPDEPMTAQGANCRST